MNIEFLKSQGIEDTDPRIVKEKLGSKEIELLDRRDGAVANGDESRIEEIDGLLEQLRAEKKQVEEELKNYVPPKEKQLDEKQQKKEFNEKKKAAYEKMMQKKKEDEKAAQAEALARASQSGGAAAPASGSQAPGSQASGSNAQPQQNVPSNGAAAKQQNGAAQNAAQQNQINPVAQAMAVMGTGDFSKGLIYYQKQDFANAFQYLVKVAEEKKPADEDAAQNRALASYVLAIMYRKGQGTKVDLDRSNHYLKRSADFGYDQAQLEYGEYLLSQNTTAGADLNVRKEGYRYIGKAADDGLTEALEKYVDLAIHSSDSDKKMVKKAKSYIAVLKAQGDSYLEAKCDTYLADLGKKDKENRKYASYLVKFVIGEILFLLGVIYLFKGLNPVFFSDFIPKISRYIPDIPDFLIIKWAKLTRVTDTYMTHQGIFGCWLIILGNAVRGLGVANAAHKCRAFAKLIKILIIALCVIHFFANLLETTKFLGNGGFFQVVAMAGSILIGRWIGKILYKMIK